MKMRPGEILVDRLESIEDTKVELNLSTTLEISLFFVFQLTLTFSGKFWGPRSASCDKPESHLAFRFHAQGFSLWVQWYFKEVKTFLPQLLDTAVSWTSQPKQWTPSYEDSQRLSTFSPNVITQGKLTICCQNIKLKSLDCSIHIFLGLSSSSPTLFLETLASSPQLSEFTSRIFRIKLFYSKRKSNDIFRAYNSSKMYRELKLRGAILEVKINVMLTF